MNKTSSLSLWGKTLVPGVALVFALAALAFFLSRYNVVFTMLTLAILLGMALGNVWKLPAGALPGVQFAKARLLRAGIVLYGFRLTMQQVAEVGVNSVFADALMLTSTFLLALWLGVYVLKMDRDIALLMGAGSGICGAAAVVATAPVLKADAGKQAVALATVVVFGTVGIFLYPAMRDWWAMGDGAYGVYIGSTVHEVAQVVAAGEAINAQVADIAVTTKMVRVMMLAPFLLVLSWFVQRGSGKVVIPWFALGFIAVVLFNSLHLLPAGWVRILLTLDTWLLAMAMAALGLTTRFAAFREAGLKPLLLGVLILLWLVGVGGVLQEWIA